MKFELQELKMDFGDTPIENIFLNEYMPSADGNFVKVYLMGYQMAHQGIREHQNFTHRTIATRLNLLETDVLRAWDYWEDVGIVEKIYDESGSYGIRFLSLKELYTKHVYIGKPAPQSEPTSFISVLDNPEIAHLFSMVDFYMRRDLSYQKKMDIAKWIEVYNMPPTLIEEAFRYGTEVKEKRNINYIEAIVRNWAEDNVRTPQALEENFKRHDERYYRYNHVLKAMGIQKSNFLESDVNQVNYWFEELNFPMEIVEEGAKRAARSNNPNLNYLETILMNWREKGLDTLEKVQQEVPPKRKVGSRHQISGGRTQTYSESELENMAARKRAEFRRKRGESS